MSAAGDAAAEQGRFAAREFAARLERDLGGDMPPLVKDRVLFAYEMGYLRGRSDEMISRDEDARRAIGRTFRHGAAADDLSAARRPKEGKDDDAESK